MVLEDWVVYDTVTQRCKNIFDNEHCKIDDQSNLTSKNLIDCSFRLIELCNCCFQFAKEVGFLHNNTLTKPR